MTVPNVNPLATITSDWGNTVADDVNANNAAVAAAQSAADTAQTAADNAQSTADTAQSTADTAQTTADAAQATADAAQSTADGKVDKTGDTMTGDLIIERNLPILNLIEADQAADSRRWQIYANNGLLTFRPATDAGGTTGVNLFSAARDGTVTMSGATAVIVPAITGANQAAQVTAYDATTGRLAIGGMEVGDTGWRNISADLINNFTGEVRIRRCGYHVEMRFDITGDGTSQSALVVGSGWRPDIKGGRIVGLAIDNVSNPAASATDTFPVGMFSSANATLRVSPSNNNQAGVRHVGQLTWTTTQPWPATLPGA